MKKLILLLSLIIGVEVAFPTPSQTRSQRDWNDIVTEKVNVSVTVDDKSIQDASVQNYVNALALKTEMEAKRLEVLNKSPKEKKLKEPDSEELTISVYSGEGVMLPSQNYVEEYIGGTNLGGKIGLGTEWMYKNVSINLGVGYTPELKNAETFFKYPVGYYDHYGSYNSSYVNKWDYINNIIGSSIGFRIYNSGDNSNNKVFAGLNLTNTSFNCNKKIIEDFTKDEEHKQIEHNLSTNINVQRVAFIAGSRHTFCNGMYLSPYAGITNITNGVLPCFGVNVGYHFHPIKCENTKNITK